MYKRQFQGFAVASHPGAANKTHETVLNEQAEAAAARGASRLQLALPVSNTSRTKLGGAPSSEISQHYDNVNDDRLRGSVANDDTNLPSASEFPGHIVHSGNDVQALPKTTNLWFPGRIPILSKMVTFLTSTLIVFLLAAAVMIMFTNTS